MVIRDARQLSFTFGMGRWEILQKRVDADVMIDDRLQTLGDDVEDDI